MNLFETFNQGHIVLSNDRKNAGDIAWSKHSAFEGVELKHLITAKETNGKFSYHLVRIAPNCSIGMHIHETQLETHEIMEGYGICTCDGEEIVYQQGVIAIISACVRHEVKAGKEGLYLFAKFIPALC